MGICMTHQIPLSVEQTEISEQFSKFRKTDQRPPMTIEHQTYDYKQNEEEQRDELFAVISCPHSIGYNNDKIALVDINPNSAQYCQIVTEIDLPSKGNEPGRMNWSKSSENFSDIDKIPRTHLIVPCMNSNKIYVINFENNTFKIEKIIRSEDLYRYDLSCPYAVNSLPINGAPVHISTMGDKNGHGKGDFILIDRKTWGLRPKSGNSFSSFGGNFSLQPRHNVIISCEWGQPRLFRDGLSASDLENFSESFGSTIHIWQISPSKLIQSIELNPSHGCLITAIRFLHNSDCNHAFACSAIGGSIFHLNMNTLTGEWFADRVAEIPSLKVEGWQSDEMPALLTDMVISMDDKWMYVCGFLHGIVWRFDIQDPFRVTLNTRINVGGILSIFPDVRVKPANTMEDPWWLPPEVRQTPKNTELRAGPALMQLSKDGERLYASNSFYKAWDAQFYPDLVTQGGQVVRIDITETSMKLNEKFLIDMKDYPNGPYVIRDIHFIDGDCTSDSFL
ncbi:unnamed protein product [Caenorhabditis bovis]|uniref:Selenium-binding protein n=1 Tax=Caenorhabditis bovis TaxID=2654633 RepID=A0A8S1E8W2_9PELO|nr:unnamed protein product [Caenorhabditis bovis]